ncbi:MAG TPA: glycosyltransferase family 39 protein [Rhizobiaceae bacterium]|nr:glycosyltransferase family 39 protein [Rhizobiaceae bacterium]
MNAPLTQPPAASVGKPLSLLSADRSLTLLITLLAAVLAVRIAGLYLSRAELFFDEAQYWAWAQDPAFGYFTKPPLIAWIITATTSVCGDTPFCVRLPSPVMHFAVALVIHAIASKLYSRRTAFWAALVYALMPGTSISATLMSTDVPLLLFWSLALLALVRHVERPSVTTGLAVGLAIGLGLNAKYAMAYFVLCFIAFAAVSPKARDVLKHSGTWTALAVALLLIAPNIVWNVEHQFATFEHTRDNAAWSGRFPNVPGLLEFISAQIGIIGPVSFVAYLVAARNRPPVLDADPRLLLLAMSLPVFVIVAAQALISKANGNWAAVGFPAAVVLATYVIVALNWRRGMIATIIISAVALVGASFAGSLAGTNVFGPIGRELGKMTGWGEFAVKTADIARAEGIQTIAYIGRGLTASMIYELRDENIDVRAYTADKTAPMDHFEMTRPWSAEDVGPVLLVFPGEGNPPKAVAGRATLVEIFDTSIFITRRHGWKASAYRVD